MSAVVIDKVWKFYGDYPALRDVAFTVEQGSCLALLGRNGAGKTTLLKILAGLSKPAKGSVTVLGADVGTRQTRMRIGLLGHGIGIYEELTAFENLRLFAKLYRVPNAEQVASSWLERVGLERMRDGLIREFSRGMRQRLAVARAFLHDPALLLLDEPFTALDDRAIAVLQELIRTARNAGRTIIMSTHQLREALELASDVALIVRGRLTYRGARTSEMLDDPSWLYRNFGEA